jgi:hypothetical protein
MSLFGGDLVIFHDDPFLLEDSSVSQIASPPRGLSHLPVEFRGSNRGRPTQHSTAKSRSERPPLSASTSKNMDGQSETPNALAEAVGDSKHAVHVSLDE